jgi:hypothetical protein
VARHAARHRLLRLRRASGCLGTSRGLARSLVVEYFTYAARPIASARRTTYHVTHRRLLRIAQAVRQLLRLSRTSGCLGSSRGLSHDSSSTTSPRAGLSSTTSPTPRARVPRHVSWLVVDYFASAVCPGASAHRAARHAARRRLLRLAQARRRLLHLRHTSGCLGTSRGSSCRSPSATSPTSRVRVPRHVARLVSPLAVDYFASATRPGASARRAARLLTVNSCIKVRLDLQVDKSPVVVKGPFFP